MFFEDEKDFIESGADIHIDEDGTVSWEDVLSDDGDELVSVKSSMQNNKQAQPVDLGDELQLVQEDEVDDSELAEILSEKEQTTKTNYNDNSQDDDEFDIDKQLANVVLEQNKQTQEDDSIKPRKPEAKKQGGISPVLIIGLVGLLLAAGYYAYSTYFAEEDFGQMPQVAQQPQVQQPVDEQIPSSEEPAQQDDMIVEEQTVQEDNTPAEETIPVVNEEQAKNVKPDEQKLLEKKPEKKQVIDVRPAGRVNPFMPNSKYISVSIPDASVDYDHSGIPKPPEKYGEQNETALKLMTIAVSGIMYDEIKPSAIITYDNNDYFVQKGDKLDNYKIVDIARNYVTVGLGSNVYRANIGEEFKISSKFSGSAQYLPQKQGGGRQYYSTAYEENAKQTDSRARYVSEDDVEINVR